MSPFSRSGNISWALLEDDSDMREASQGQPPACNLPAARWQDRLPATQLQAKFDASLNIGLRESMKATAAPYASEVLFDALALERAHPAGKDARSNKCRNAGELARRRPRAVKRAMLQTFKAIDSSGTDSASSAESGTANSTLITSTHEESDWW
mmetsp:Transcript_42325/g.80966  ORF Transcript_42325/g.80966 Transcript_42325/m.80966 type:complete len:154 (+) Transcript_42325:92-553(+)